MTIDAHGPFFTGDDEDHADMRILHDVRHALKHLVARAVREVQGALVSDMEKPRRVAFGRGVTAPLRIGRGDNDKRTLSNEADRCFVKVGKLVFNRQILGRAKTFTEVLGSAWSC